MRSILGERASKAAKKQTMEKLAILREVVEEMAKERKELARKLILKKDA
jgi:hypothetical protein